MEPALVHEGLAVYSQGSGEAVLVMPGPHRLERPGFRAADALLDGLASIGRRPITFDPPGSGRSPRAARLGLVEMFDCSDEVLRSLQVDTPVDVLGHSMGGLVTLAYALERPAQVRRLVLVGTGSGGPAYEQAPGSLWNRAHPRYRAMARLSVLQLLWPARAPERLLMNLIRQASFVDTGLAQPDPVSLGDWFRGREGRTDWHWIARKLDFSPRLAEIQAPTLVLCGRHDPQFPLAASNELAAGIPGARLAVFDRSGHYPFLEEPGEFWTAVADFLA